jgi:UDP-GlcNAc3NAcA epimerase
MKKILTVIGARPQIIKAASISRAINNYFKSDFVEVIIHTGQHYDSNMSDVFFQELGIPHPNYNLNVGSGSHGAQTAKMIEGIENVILAENPDYLLLYGDTNSTLAGAIAASKIHIPIVHIEAGLRSFNKKMPEEINRILTDHCATFLFPPTETGYNNLLREGFLANNQPPYHQDNPWVQNVGDVMFDNSLYFKEIANLEILTQNELKENQYILVTIHRNNNTDIPERLQNIVECLIEITEERGIDMILPLHPRTKTKLQENLKPETFEIFTRSNRIKIVEPVSFLEMITLEAHAKCIITDSGGVQKEAYFFKKPCVILRSETEWVEIIEVGAAYICDADKQQILEKAEVALNQNMMESKQNLFGDGQAAKKILEVLKNNITL